MNKPTNFNELRDLINELIPGAVVSADYSTWEVVIHTKRFLANGDVSDTLMTEKEQKEHNVVLKFDSHVRPIVRWLLKREVVTIPWLEGALETRSPESFVRMFVYEILKPSLKKKFKETQKTLDFAWFDELEGKQ